MPKPRPFAIASSVTALVLVLVLGLTGGHSPFTTVEAAGVPTPSPLAIVDGPSGDPAGSPPPGPSPTRKPDRKPARQSTPRPDRASSGGGRSAGGGATAKPTPRPSPKATSKPTPEPTPKPTPRPTTQPPADQPWLTAEAGSSAVQLAWSACSSSAFDAYAVVRSADREIHFPPEDRDTVVAIVSSRSATSLVDHDAPPGTRSTYRVWCVSRHDGEYKAIWSTPSVSVTP